MVGLFDFDPYRSTTVKLALPKKVKNTDWGCLGTGCWGE